MSLNVRQLEHIHFGYQPASGNFQNFRDKLSSANSHSIEPVQVSSETVRVQQESQPTSFAEGFVNTVDYTKAAIFGTIEGVIIGGLAYLGVWGAKLARAGFIKSISKAMEYKPGIIGKTLAIGAGVGTLAYSLFKTHLNIKKRAADIR